MDIAKPNLQYIDGICYRINPGNFASNYDRGSPQSYECDEEFVPTRGAEIEDDYEVETLPNGKLQTSFHVAKTFFSYIIGTKGSTRRRLENETKTTITIPKLGCEGDVVIIGIERRNVVSARNRVVSLVSSARRKMSPTHFLSFPLNGKLFQERFNCFKKNVLENCPGITEDLFVESESLHLTLGVMVLCDDVERAAAADALHLCHNEVIKEMLKGELKVKMSGLDYMTDDPSKVNVLYGKVMAVNDDFSLQKFVDAIYSFFLNKELIKKEWGRDGVLIHATFLNTKKSNDDKKEKVNQFDASKIMELYGDFDFGEGIIPSLEISIMHSNKPGYWPSTASVPLS